MKIWHPWRGLERLPRVAWALSGVTLVNRAGTMVLPFLVLYLTEELKLEPREAGRILIAYGAGSIAAAPLAGWLTDRIGPVRLMKASLALTGAIVLVMPVAHTGLAFGALTFVWALVADALRPANLAVLSDAVPAEERKAAFALNRLAINLGMSIGPVIGGFLASVSYLYLFAADGATSLAAAIVLAVAVRGARIAPHHATAAATDAPSRWGALSDRRLLVFVAGALPVALVFFQNVGPLPLYLVRDLGYSERAFGLLASLNTVLIVFLEVPLNLAMAEWPHRATLALGALLAGAGFGAVALATSPWAVAATIVVWTFGEMILFPSMAALVAELAPAERRGAYMSVYSLIWSVAFALGPWLGTVVMDRFGPGALWTSCLAGGALSAAVLGLAPSGQRRG